MDWRSFLHNAEINIIAVDANLAAELEHLYADDIASSRPISLEEWNRRGWTHRLKESLARKAEFFL
jgi:cardiolipin synthase